MKDDPNLIYPGSDLTNVFPEEGSDMTLTDQEKKMMQRMENSIAATPTQAQIEAAVGRKFRTFGGGVGSDYNPIAEALKDKPLTFAAGVSVAEVVEFVLTAAAEVGEKDAKRAAIEVGRVVRAETIERCAMVADNAALRAKLQHESGYDDCYLWCHDEARGIAAAIRALAENPHDPVGKRKGQQDNQAGD